MRQLITGLILASAATGCTTSQPQPSVADAPIARVGETIRIAVYDYVVTDTWTVVDREISYSNQIYLPAIDESDEPMGPIQLPHAGSRECAQAIRDFVEQRIVPTSPGQFDTRVEFITPSAPGT